ncbi:MAG: Rrf2 family transcriptional regulator [Rhodospirillales bacterium]|jgi:Rrf2 family protein|nr:Rrf2 family transcriptional regulator [Rhodospirillales bacterium]
MLRLSKKILFAIEAVVDIAYHAGSQPVQSRDITRRQGIPRRYLEQALQQLVRANVLIGIRGPRGGYNLARERRRISAGDIVRVMRQLESANDPLEQDNGSELTRTVIRPMWQEVQSEMMVRLDEISVDDLCQDANKAGVDSEGRQNLDFTI